MKVKELLERYGQDSIPVAVEYELEYTTPEGDVDYKMISIPGVVTTTPDAYSTGDSPTDYEFDVDYNDIVDTDYGKKITQQELASISKDDWIKIEQQAIEQVNRRR